MDLARVFKCSCFPRGSARSELQKRGTSLEIVATEMMKINHARRNTTQLFATTRHNRGLDPRGSYSALLEDARCYQDHRLNFRCPDHYAHRYCNSIHEVVTVLEYH